MPREYRDRAPDVIRSLSAVATALACGGHSSRVRRSRAFGRTGVRAVAAGRRIPDVQRDGRDCWRRRLWLRCGSRACANAGFRQPLPARSRSRGPPAATSLSPRRSCCGIPTGRFHPSGRACFTSLQRSLVRRRRRRAAAAASCSSRSRQSALPCSSSWVFPHAPRVRPLRRFRMSRRSRPARSADVTTAATVTPPPYTHDPPRVLQNPERIEALQGSRLTLRVDGGDGWKIRFGAEDLEATTSGTITTVDVDLVKSGYLAVEPRSGDATALRRLLPVTVIPDRAPTIRVEAPGQGSLAARCEAGDRTGGRRHGRLRPAVARAALHEGVRLGRAVRVQGRHLAACHRARHLLASGRRPRSWRCRGSASSRATR